MEHEIRRSLENVTARLRSAVDTELDQLAAELMRAIDAISAQARAEAEAVIEARVAAARAQADAALAARESDFAAREEQIRAAAMAEAYESAQRDVSDAAAVQVTEREGRLESVERLLASVRRLDAASGLRETLEVLVQSASLETPRVAVLLIEGSNVRTFAHRGFTDVPDSGPLAHGGVVEASARHGQPAFTSDTAGLRAPGFAALPADRAGFAAPLRVGNRVVAVLYADDAGSSAPEAPAAWPEALELLARHASLHLENLTAVKSRHVEAVPQAEPVADAAPTARVAAPVPVPVAAPAAPQTQPEVEPAAREADEEAAKRYARLLVSEIKLYNEVTVRQGREHRDLRRRLLDEIEHAERTYLERIPETVTARRAYFEAELVETLGGGDAATLGPPA